MEGEKKCIIYPDLLAKGKLLENHHPTVVQNITYLLGKDTLKFSENLDQHGGKDVGIFNTISSKYAQVEYKNAKRMKGVFLYGNYFKKKDKFDGEEVEAEITYLASAGEYEQEAKELVENDPKILFVNSPTIFKHNPNRHDSIENEQFLFTLSNTIAEDQALRIVAHSMSTQKLTPQIVSVIKRYDFALKCIQWLFQLYIMYYGRKTIDLKFLPIIERIKLSLRDTNKYLISLEEKVDNTLCQRVFRKPYVLQYVENTLKIVFHTVAHHFYIKSPSPDPPFLAADSNYATSGSSFHYPIISSYTYSKFFNRHFLYYFSYTPRLLSQVVHEIKNLLCVIYGDYRRVMWKTK